MMIKKQKNLKAIKKKQKGKIETTSNLLFKVIRKWPCMRSC